VSASTVDTAPPKEIAVLGPSTFRNCWHLPTQHGHCMLAFYLLLRLTSRCLKLTFKPSV
jgi:hypothetical protein